MPRLPATALETPPRPPRRPGDRGRPRRRSAPSRDASPRAPAPGARRAPRRARAAAKGRPAPGRCAAPRHLLRGPRQARPAAAGRARGPPARSVQLRVHRGRAQPARRRDEHERHGGSADRLHPLAGPATIAWPGAPGSARRFPGPRPSSQGRLADRRQPPCAARSTAAASALPPPRPAATGIRLSIVDPQRRWLAAPPPGTRPARAPARFSPSTPGADHLVASRPPSIVELVGQVDRGEQRRPGVHPVRPRRPDPQHQIHLRRGALGHRARRSEPQWLLPSSSARRANSCGESRSARVSSGCPSSASAARAASRIPSGAPGARASEPASVLRRWANAACTSADSRGRGAGAVAPEHHQRGVHVGLGVEHRARHLAHHLHLAGQLGQHRGGAVGLAARRRREAVPHLALHHRHEQASRRAAPRRP